VESNETGAAGNEKPHLANLTTGLRRYKA